LSLFLRLPQPGGPGSCIYFTQEQSSTVIPRPTSQVKVTLRPTISWPVSLWREDRSAIYCSFWSSPELSCLVLLVFNT
jgi:hypothetical protein